MRGHTHWSSVRSHLFTLITCADPSVDGCVFKETCLCHVPNMKKQVKFVGRQMIHRLHHLLKFVSVCKLLCFSG